jgi:hypothetical protein
MWDYFKRTVIDPLKVFAHPAPPDLRENPRLTSYLDYRLNDAIVNYIEVDDTRLYYEAFNKEETVQTLQEQYVKFHGKEMTLESENVKISPTMPLMEIISTPEDRRIFQEIVQIVNKPEKKKEDVEEKVVGMGMGKEMEKAVVV